MGAFKPTPEQAAVIAHDSGHARVLAVAGSGKTATMVHRIKFLIDEKGVDPKSIRALMFNALAKKQFDEKLDELLAGSERPPVSTFHGFGYQFIQFVRRHGLMESFVLWTGDDEERARLLLHKCIRSLERDRTIPEDSVDIDDALEAIGLWKGALISPENAGHMDNEFIPLVYAKFESERRMARALTFDDFVPVVVRLLENSESLASTWCNRYEHLIIDEYQDVNYGQQRLIELLAGNKAEVMVVGDDDQTIYEWRGARPSYILRDFRERFPNKPHAIYHLTRTFRFGPMVAQVAQNTISHNSNRVEKEVISFFTDKSTEVSFHCASESRADINFELADEIATLLAEGASANEIWALGRMFVQLSGLQVACIDKQIPFRVLGGSPFFERAEIQRLLQYILVARELDQPISSHWSEQFKLILNVPSRKIRRDLISLRLRRAQNSGLSGRDFLQATMRATQQSTGKATRQVPQLASGMTILQAAHQAKRQTTGMTIQQAIQQVTRQAIQQAAQDNETKLYPAESNALRKLFAALDKANKQIRSEALAESVISNLIDDTEYFDHYIDYYGGGEASHERIESVKSFVTYVTGLKIPASQIVEFIASLDITRGQPPEKLITFTTTYRTKGLEFDHVFIPDCIEGYMPCLFSSGSPIFDKSGKMKEADTSYALESERRLFYVAVTRARKTVRIGFPTPAVGNEKESTRAEPSRFLEEMQFDLTKKMFTPITGPKLSKQQKEQWMEAVNANAGQKKITRNLSHYLGEIGEIEDAKWVGALAEKVDVAKFKYKRTYRNMGKLTKKPVESPLVKLKKDFSDDIF